MLNLSFSQLLSEMADLLELSEDNPFRIRAFRRAALTLESYQHDLTTLSRDQILEIPGVGKGIADLLEEFKAKGEVVEWQRLRAKFPGGVLDIMRLQGLGPKRAAILFRELKVDSLEKLAQAAKGNKLTLLHGFGEKIQQNILRNLDFATESLKRLVLSNALAQIEQLRKILSSSPHIRSLTHAGSARRWKETVGDFDFLCTSTKPEDAIADFIRLTVPSEILASGKTKASVRLKNNVQCDFRVVEEKSFGAALLYFTGSKEHNVRLRELAQKKGWTLNEYGLFKQSDKKQSKPLASKTEEDVYAALGLPWIPPELREDRGEVQAGLNNTLPKLVTEKDVLGDVHNHTELSDGEHTLKEMIEAAREKNWKWFFSADHSPSLKVASGLPIPALRRKIAQIRKLDSEKVLPRVFCSSEVDILGDGSLDYPDEVLAELDCVVASVHSRFNQSAEEMTDRICKAMASSHVDVIGHLTGRLINRREGYNLHMDKILDTARSTETALEINGQPDRAELKDIHVKAAIERGVPLILTTDAHSMQQLSNMTVAVHVARRGWAEPRHLLNSLTIDSLLKWLNNN